MPIPLVIVALASLALNTGCDTKPAGERGSLSSRAGTPEGPRRSVESMGIESWPPGSF